jgi:signal transduction histidine kinase
MTRTLARSILLIVWATLIAGGIVAYIITRSVLLKSLDETLMTRARALPELSATNESAGRTEDAAEDRYVISNKLHQTLARHPEGPLSAPKPLKLDASLTKLGDGQRVRTLTLRFPPRGGGESITVVYSSSAERLCGVLNTLAIALTAFGVIAGIAGAAIAVVVSRTALRPLRRTADVIGGIDERKLDRRIDPSALPDELRAVADRLNEMLSRLEQAFAQRKQFLADASHELRTPVAALVTTIEVALRRPRDAAELTRVLRTCHSDATLLRELVQTLLVHARGESTQANGKPELFDAAALFNRCADIADGLALGKDVTVCRILPPTLEIRSQPQRLRGIVMNLLGNAIEYNRPGGMVELKAEIDGGDLRLTVRDTGRGIAAEHLPHLFQPFYRASDPAFREGQEDQHHLGLGLFLVDSHLRALGGVCKIESEPGTGTTMRIHIPQVAALEPAMLEGVAV